jgi:cytochrome oxidase Cu insertion factor (SCO1/SenC/PrrC family)
MSKCLKISAVLFFLLFCAGLYAYTDKWLGDHARAAQGVAAENFGGDFTLVNQDGKTVTEKDFKGTWRLMYFGFTYCPAICPTELAKITASLNKLGDKAKIIHPIFISVDPERDTPKTIKSYLKSFHPSFTGLTGTVDQIAVVKKAYKVYAAKVKEEKMTDYTVDHSSFIYLMDPKENLLSIYKIQDSAEIMTEDIKARLP